MPIKNKQKSFTLIELLVVIVIIGILAGVIMISTSSSIDKANFAKAQVFSKTIQNEMLLNLVSEWTFDEPEESGKTKDSWGSSHGTFSGTPVPSYQNLSSRNCLFGGCYSFSGDGCISCGNNANLSINDKLTFSFWLKPGNQSANYDRVIEKGDWKVGGYSIQQRQVGENEIMFIFGSLDGWAGHFAPSVKYIPDEWNYVVSTIDLNIGGQSYINGISAGSPNSPLPYITTNNLFTIGRNFDGLIDDVRIYDAVLSSSQVKQNYIAGLNSLIGKGLILEAEFKEKVADLSSNK